MSSTWYRLGGVNSENRMPVAMRHALGNKPWFGCTATLDESTLNKVCDFAAFKVTTEAKRFSIDHPDVAIIRAVMSRSDKSSLKHLRFIVADAAKRRDGSRVI
jgi:hypothetical protein